MGMDPAESADERAAALVKTEFFKFDVDGTGHISPKELSHIIRTLMPDITDEKLQIILNATQRGDDGQLCYTSFVNWIFSIKGKTRRALVRCLSRHDAGVGEIVKINQQELTGQVVQLDKNKVQVKLVDGFEEWYDVAFVVTDEDQPIVGKTVQIRQPSITGQVLLRTTTDVQVELPNGGEVCYGVEDIDSLLEPADEVRLREIFKQCDTSGDGMINKRELIKVCRSSEDVAEFFVLPTKIMHDDGSRDAVERFFQKIDTNSDRMLSWSEFRNFYVQSVHDCWQAPVEPMKALQ